MIWADNTLYEKQIKKGRYDMFYNRLHKGKKSKEKDI